VSEAIASGLTVALLVWILGKLYSLERRVARLEAKINNLYNADDAKREER